MCGISGIFDPFHKLSGSQIEAGVKGMITEFGYRGPDDKGTLVNAATGLG